MAWGSDWLKRRTPSDDRHANVQDTVFMGLDDEHEPTVGDAESARGADISVTSAVSASVLDALRAGKEIHQLSFGDIESVAAEASSLTLDEIEDDLLRKKIVDCVTGHRIHELLPFGRWR